MFKQKSLYFVFAMILIALLAIGCSKENDNGGKTSGDTSSTSDTLEVISKTQQAMTKLNGYNADVKIQMTDSASNMQSDINQSITTTRNPVAFHVLSNTSAAGAKIDTELYYDGGIIYNKMAGKWMKMTSPSVDAIVQQSQQSENLIKTFQALIQAAQTGNKTDSITMTQTSSGDYQINIDINSTKGGQKLLDVLDKSLGSQMGQALQNVKINNYKTSILLDGKSYLYKTINTDLQMSVSVNGTNTNIKQHQELTFKGEFTGKINVPADVKSSATEMNSQFAQ